MSYEEIKDKEHFAEFVKRFQSQREKIKSALVAKKIGDEQRAHHQFFGAHYS